MISSLNKNLRKRRNLDLAAMTSKSKRKGLGGARQGRWLENDLMQPLRQPENKSTVFSLQRPKRGNVEGLLDCSPKDLHLTIERLTAIRRIGKFRFRHKSDPGVSRVSER